MVKYLVGIATLIFCINICAQNLNRFIEVTGTHQLNIEADQIILTLSVKSIEDILEDSKDKNSSIIDKLINKLNDFTINKNDIELTPISFGINYKRDAYTNIKDGYYTSQQIIFTLNDLSKYYDLIDQIINIENVSITKSYYNNSKYEEHNKNAYEHAVMTAKEKAEYLAKKAEVKLGKVLEIEDNTGEYYRRSQIYPNPFNTSTSVGSQSNEVLGSISINRSVRIKYEIIE